MSRRKLYFLVLFIVWMILIPIWGPITLLICLVMPGVIEMIENPERRKPMSILKRLDLAVGKIVVLIFSFIGGVVGIIGLLVIGIIWLIRSIVDNVFTFLATEMMGEERYKFLRDFIIELVPGICDEMREKIVSD